MALLLCSENAVDASRVDLILTDFNRSRPIPQNQGMRGMMGMMMGGPGMMGGPKPPEVTGKEVCGQFDDLAHRLERAGPQPGWRGVRAVQQVRAAE